jgi:hypothetical protein
MKASSAITIVPTCMTVILPIVPGSVQATAEKHSVQYFVDSLFYPTGGGESDDFQELCPAESATVSIDTVGPLQDHLVIEVDYSCSDSDWCDEGKAILYRSSQQNFELLYAYLNDCTEVNLQPAAIVVVDSVPVLYTRSPLTGTGGYVEERYWVWSDNVDKPVDLKLEQATHDALSRVLPENYGLAYGGFFDISTLALDCYVRRPGDYNCCPTGGWIELRYKIEDSALRVISCRYDPDKVDSGGSSGND